MVEIHGAKSRTSILV